MSTITRLPRPILDNYAWQQQGLCRGRDVEQFFIDDPEMGPAGAQRPDRGGEGSVRGLPGGGPVPAARPQRSGALRHLGRHDCT